MTAPAPGSGPLDIEADTGRVGVTVDAHDDLGRCFLERQRLDYEHRLANTRSDLVTR
ncbi:MAG TPA: hypothetical protein VFD97_00330 [Acidimicrobiia bacterium]|nr:hypothetical protein [Acidimicrobiia bacterium]